MPAIADLGRVSEVKKRDCAIVEHEVVARMGVGVEAPEPAHRPEEEPHDDLPQLVTPLLVVRAGDVEAMTVHPFADEHALARERSHDRRDVHERVAAVGPGKRPLLLRLELKVQLLKHALTQFGGDDPGVETGGDRLSEPDRHRGELEVGLDCVGDLRVLDLDRDLAAILEHAPVDLPDRGGRHRLW